MGMAFRRSGRAVCPLAKVSRSFLVFACAGIVLVAGCSRPVTSPPAITVEHTILPNPPRIGPTLVTLRLADTTAKPVSGARIALEANMSHAGMAPVFGEAKEIGPGQYQAHLTFEMAGDWVILLHVKLPGGQTLERQVNVGSVRPN
jgi:hypothetical protein